MAVSDTEKSHLNLRFLGGCEITLNGEAVRLETAKTTALLAYLALQGGPQTRHKLVGLLWEDLPEEKAGRNLRRALWDVRKKLSSAGEAAFLLADRQTVRFDRKAGCWLDTEVFQNACGALKSLPASETADLDHLGTAVALYRGDLLDGFYADGAPAFEDWLIAERERLRGTALEAFQKLAALHRHRGEVPAGLAFARRLLALDPWREEAHRIVMELMALAGQRGAALAQYETCRRVLAEELRAEPTRETTALFERIRDGLLERSVASAPEPSRRPGVPSPPHNIPLQATPFVGREEELARIADLLADPACRLLTLVGPGGVGKTRLAIQAALQIAAPGERPECGYPDGLHFVPLAELGSPALLVPTLAGTLRFSFLGASDPKAQLLEFLREKRALLILDNFEHLLAAAPFLTDLLAAAPGVKLLVTSRERLRRREEWLLELGGLRVPAEGEAAAPSRASALQLFLQSARRVQISFVCGEEETPQLVRVCRLVDGMPLGIELAAAWVRTLSLPEIAKEIETNLDFLSTDMGDVPSRQRSLRAIFDSTWKALSEGEKAVFAALSTFRGGFTREAARAVAGASLPDLSALVDRSLLRRDPSGRFHHHPVLGQYAAEKLSENPAQREGALNRHGAYFVASLRGAGPRLWGPSQAQAFREIGEELENLRAAWNWAVSGLRTGDLGGLLEPLGLIHDVRGWFEEWERTLAEAIQRWAGPGGEERTRLLGRLHAQRGHFLNRMGLHGEALKAIQESCRLLGDGDHAEALAAALLRLGETRLGLSEYAESRRVLEESLDLARRCEDRMTTVRALGRLGRVDIERGALEEANARLEEALDLARAAGDETEMTYALNQLGHAAYFQRRYERARAFLVEALDLARKSGNRADITLAINGLGYVAEDLGDHAGAKTLYEEGLAIGRETGDRLGVTRQLTLLGEVARRQQAWREAKDLYQKAIAAGRETGNQYFLSANLGNLAFVAAELGELDEALALAREAAKVGSTARSLALVLPALVGAAAVYAKRSDADRALALLGLVSSHPAYRADTKLEVDHVLSALREALPVEAIEAGLEAGRSMDFELVLEDFLRNGGSG